MNDIQEFSAMVSLLTDEELEQLIIIAEQMLEEQENQSEHE